MGQGPSSPACRMYNVNCAAPSVQTTTTTTTPTVLPTPQPSISSTTTTSSTTTFPPTISDVISSTLSIINRQVNSTSSVASSASSSASSSTASSSASGGASAAAVVASPKSVTVAQTMLVFAMDAYSAKTGTSGFKAYGIPFETVIVPKEGINLPQMNTSATSGKYGGIVTMNELSYNYGGTIGWRSALTTDQWNQIYAYQQAFGVRLVRLDAYPDQSWGVLTQKAGVGCCGNGVEQKVYFTNTTDFATAGLLTGSGASVTTIGTWHYPAVITNSTIAKAIAAFAPSSDGTFTTESVAAVINTFPGRQQMVWFMGFATDWSGPANFLQHAHIHWLTRGMYAGYRRILFNTQIDDMHLSTTLYQSESEYRITTKDLDAYIPWQQSMRSRLPRASNYTMEIGHNGNGAVIVGTNIFDADGNTICNPDSAIYYDEQPAVPLEYQKPLGTGNDVWPATPTNYTWSLACISQDPVAAWFQKASNRDAFMHLTHTFSHMNLNAATYKDAYKEIQFNQAWMRQMGISNAKWFSGAGIIPPAITGLHNGDVFRAWRDLGLTSSVGDNTRPPLMSGLNEYWPLVTNMSANGFDGFTIMPRWSTTIFYNCNNQTCTTNEWINTSGGAGDFNNLLQSAKNEHIRHIFSLRQDPFMFHQANLDIQNAPVFTVGNQSGKLSIFQIWVETILQEYARLANWPILTVKHQDVAQFFRNRMARDQCGYKLSYITNAAGTAITQAVITANNNRCAAPVPVTLPGAARSSATTTLEQIGNDPPTQWVRLNGSPVTLTLTTPIVL